MLLQVSTSTHLFNTSTRPHLPPPPPAPRFKEGRMLLQVSTLARTPPRDSLTAMSAAHKASGAAPAANSLMQGHWV